MASQDIATLETNYSACLATQQELRHSLSVVLTQTPSEREHRQSTLTSQEKHNRELRQQLGILKSIVKGEKRIELLENAVTNEEKKSSGSKAELNA